MLTTDQNNFIKLFNELDGQQEDGGITYSMNEIIFLVLVAALSGSESWNNIVEYVATRQEMVIRQQATNEKINEITATLNY